MTLAFSLFIAGILTIFLPCILPLVPIVLGVSIAGRSPWRPLLVIIGMVISFVAFTFLLLIVLRQFVWIANLLRIATYYILLLFGLGFVTENQKIRLTGATLGAGFFWILGWQYVLMAALLGAIATLAGGKISSHLQQFGIDVQRSARSEFGDASPVTALAIGLTLGLVWVPCAGPALSFAYALIQEEPGLRAMLLLGAYALGTSVPLLLIGYGGQKAVRGVRSFNRYSGLIKRSAGVLLILSALALYFNVFRNLQAWLIEHTAFGSLGTQIEEKWFGELFQR